MKKRTDAIACDVNDVQESGKQNDRNLDELCENWVAWSRTRRLYAPNSSLPGTLSRLSGTTRPLRLFRAEAVSSAELSAFHIAYTCQPDALDKRVFETYYVLRIKPVKRAAAALGISREHFHRVLATIRRRIAESAWEIEKGNEHLLDSIERARASTNRES